MDTNHKAIPSKNEEYELLRTVNEALSQLLQHEDEAKALDAAFQLVCTAAGCDGVYLFRQTNSATQLSTQVHFALRKREDKWNALSQKEIDFLMNNGSIQTELVNLFQEEESLILHRKYSAEKWNIFWTEMEIESFFGFELVVNKKHWGIVLFVSRIYQEHWTKTSFKLLLPFINGLAGFLAYKQTEQQQIQQN
ncbi:MAG: hypothetical protein SFU99_22790, partial [Saprospiraceae bacterium]|nr:hypothetical protein [Saprospiraceae bacterium]